MTEPDAHFVRASRILVALDTSARGRAALQAAVRLARNMRAELQGLFIEDEDLVRLAALPFSREVDLESASPRQLHSSHMEHALRAAAEETHRAFADALRQLNLQWSFRVMRGAITRTSLAAGGDVDLLVIGQQGRWPRVGDNQEFAKRQSFAKRVVAVFDGSASALRTLELGSRLTEPNSHVLHVLVLANTADVSAQRCANWLQQRSILAQVDQLLDPSEGKIVEFLRTCNPGLLLINRDSQFVTDTHVNRLVNEFDCPLILC